MFEGVQADDQRYRVLYTKDKVVIVYPNNIVVVYIEGKVHKVV